MWLSGRRADKQEAETQLLKTVPMTEKVLHSGRIFCKIIERQKAKSARSALSEKTAADCRVRRRTEQTDTNAPNYSNNYNNNYNYIYNCNEGDVEAFCSICCRTKKTDPNYFCVKLRPRRPLRQQYRKKTEGKMLKINRMIVTDGTGAALVSDSVKEYIVEVNYSYQDKPYRVSIYKGELLESYDELQYSMRSRFAEIFICLRRGISTCNSFFGTGILQKIASSITFEEEGSKYTAVNHFLYQGEEYLATVVKDYSSEIPVYTYTVSGINLENIEAYPALYHALDSEFYPVLADLDRDLEKYMEGKTDRGGQQA